MHTDDRTIRELYLGQSVELGLYTLDVLSVGKRSVKLGIRHASRKRVKLAKAGEFTPRRYVADLARFVDKPDLTPPTE